MDNDNQYCIMTGDEEFAKVVSWINSHKVRHEVHINRTRFWIPDNLEESFVRSGIYKYCRVVHGDEDLVTGQRP